MHVVWSFQKINLAAKCRLMDVPAPWKGGRGAPSPRQRSGREGGSLSLDRGAAGSTQQSLSPRAGRAWDAQLLLPEPRSSYSPTTPHPRLPRSPEGRRFLKSCDGISLALPGLMFRRNLQPTNQIPWWRQPQSPAWRPGRRNRGVQVTAEGRRGGCHASTWLHHQLRKLGKAKSLPPTPPLSGPALGWERRWAIAWVLQVLELVFFRDHPCCCHCIPTWNVKNEHQGHLGGSGG